MPAPLDLPSPARGGIVVARVWGVELVVHPSWLVTFVVLALFARNTVASRLDPEPSAAAAWALGVALALGLSLSVVVHEMCHALVARASGLDARRITLFLFGGIAQVGKEAPGPAVEFRIAVAGPLASVLIAGTLAVVARLLHPGREGLPGAWGMLAAVNLALALFNLVPGFPLDGGRILRSALWAGLRDRARATRWAALGGRGVALALMGLGAAFFARSFVTGGEGADGAAAVWYVLLGWFLYGAAGSAGRAEGGARPRSGQVRPDGADVGQVRPDGADVVKVVSHEGDAAKPDPRHRA